MQSEFDALVPSNHPLILVEDLSLQLLLLLNVGVEVLREGVGVGGGHPRRVTRLGHEKGLPGVC